MTLPLAPPYPPMEARLVTELPRGPHWQYEPKWDGFRCIAFRDGDRVELQSKAGQPPASGTNTSWPLGRKYEPAPARTVNAWRVVRRVPSCASHRKPSSPSTGKPSSAFETRSASDGTPGSGDTPVQDAMSSRRSDLPSWLRTTFATSSTVRMRMSPSYMRQGLDCRPLVKRLSRSGTAGMYSYTACAELTQSVGSCVGEQVSTLSDPDRDRCDVSHASAAGLSRRVSRTDFMADWSLRMGKGGGIGRFFFRQCLSSTPGKSDIAIEGRRQTALLQRSQRNVTRQ